MHILGKSYEVLVVGVDVGELDVDQQQNLKAEIHDDARQQIDIQINKS